MEDEMKTICATALFIAALLSPLALSEESTGRPAPDPQAQEWLRDWNACQKTFANTTPTTLTCDDEDIEHIDHCDIFRLGGASLPLYVVFNRGEIVYSEHKSNLKFLTYDLTTQTEWRCK